MATVRLDAFSEDTIVLHFGGPEGTIDAYTLANALIGFADTAYAINDTLDPGQEIEIVIEATGPGSYRTVVRRLKKGFAGGVLSGIAATIFWNVVSNAIYDATLIRHPSCQASPIVSTAIEKKSRTSLSAAMWKAGIAHLELSRTYVEQLR